MRILVTGGRGVLGRELVSRFRWAGHAVRAASRSVPTESTVELVSGPGGPGGEPGPRVEWVQADLATGAGLAAAIEGIQTVVHAATSPFRATRAVDVDGTARLIEAARAAGVGHLVYVSIVGVDQIHLPYCRHKLAAEARVQEGSVPFSILRATQFHSLLARPLEALGGLPIRVVPAGFQFQPVDSGDVAERLVEVAIGQPAGRLPDFGGPAVRRIEDLTRAWAAVRRRWILVLPIPLPGATAAAFRAGLNTCPDRAVGRVTWEDYLRRREPSPAPSRDGKPLTGPQ